MDNIRMGLEDIGINVRKWAYSAQDRVIGEHL